VADPRFPRPGLANLDFLPDQNFGTAGLMKADGVRHGITPQKGMAGAGDVAAELTRPLALVPTICAEWAARNTLRATLRPLD
jgi:hypothetical protein